MTTVYYSLYSVNMPPIYKILLGQLSPFKWKLLYVILLMFTVIILEILSPWPFKYLIDNVLSDTPVSSNELFGLFSTFTTRQSLGIAVIFLFFLLNSLNSSFEYLRSIETKKVTKSLIYNFSKSSFENLERFAIGFYRNKQIGDYIYRINYDIASLSDLVENGYLSLLTSVIYLIATTIILFLINKDLTLLSITVVPVLTIGLYYINKRIKKASEESELRSSTLFSFIEQALSQLKIIQAYSQEKQELSDYSRKIKGSLKSDYKVEKLNFILSLVVGLIIAISYSLIIGYGMQAVFSGTITAGILIVYIFYLDNLTNPLLSIIYAISVIKESFVKVERMAEFFDASSQISDTGHVQKISDTAVRFEHVTLRGYDDKLILNDVSLKIPKEKITVLVGVSGSGKTSIISLIPRLINEPTSGNIFIGKHNIKDYSVKALRENIGYVPQEILLFNTTIKDVISFGKDHATMAEIEKAAQLSVADEFILRKKKKYDFNVGEEGNYLSGGQRQRLMLARAIIKNAKILILDEVFSSQDIKTRFEMVANLRKYAVGKTVIIVSNVLEIISEADFVIVVNNSKIIQAGSHQELLHGNFLKKSNYYKLLLGND